MPLADVCNTKYSHSQVFGASTAGRQIPGQTNSVPHYTTKHQAAIWHLALPSPGHGLYLGPILLLAAMQRALPNGRNLGNAQIIKCLHTPSPKQCNTFPLQLLNVTTIINPYPQILERASDTARRTQKTSQWICS
jgi:hypothetical protein